MAKDLPSVGFIGLGLMGKPMALNIHKAGFPLSVFNRSEKRTTEFKRLGVAVFDSPKTLAENVDIIVSCVTGPKDVREIYLGKKGVAMGAKTGMVVIDMSTIGPVAAKEIHDDLKECGISFIDAPVTGSVERATAGTLFIFAGGSKKALDIAMPVLQAMGEKVNLMGPVGSGQAVKLVNNLIVGESLAALAEGMLLADSMGLPRKKVAESLEDVPALSPMMRMKLPNMVKDHFPTAFSISNMRKDLKLALDQLEKGSSLPFLKLVDKLYKSGIDQGLGESDNSGILEILSKTSKNKK